MASSLSFVDWSKRRSSEAIMDTAEDLLDKLESLSDLLTEIEQKYIKIPDGETENLENHSILQRFRHGLDSARNLISVLKREKWRLSKREMSVELRMGELEDYKSHLKQDMSNMNETVEMLSLRVVQLENSLCEAQDTQESNEAEIAELKSLLTTQEQKVKKIEDQKLELLSELKSYRDSSTPEAMKKEIPLRMELDLLRDENKRLKDMIRRAEASVAAMLKRQNSSTESQGSVESACGLTLLQSDEEDVEEDFQEKLKVDSNSLNKGDNSTVTAK